MEGGVENYDCGFVIDDPKMFDEPLVCDEDDAVPDDEEVMIFTRNFPKTRYYRNRLKDGWPTVESALQERGISCSLNLKKCYMSVSTTKGLDPDIFDKAKDILRLLSINFVPPMSIKILEGIPFEIIDVGFQEDGMCSKFGVKEEQFLEQRKQLVADIPYIHELEKLIQSRIFIADAAVVVVGSTQAVKYVRDVVYKCIVGKRHLAYYVKTLKSARMKEVEKKLEVLCI